MWSYNDNSKEEIIDKCTLNVPVFPSLTNVLHVDGLLTNLINISQLCYDNLHVTFGKNSCFILDDFNNCLMIENMSIDNYYTIGDNHMCKSVKVDESVLYHKNLGHTNFRNFINQLNMMLWKVYLWLSINIQNMQCMSKEYISMCCTKCHCMLLNHIVLNYCIWILRDILRLKLWMKKLIKMRILISWTY